MGARYVHRMSEARKESVDSDAIVFAADQPSDPTDRTLRPGELVRLTSFIAVHMAAGAGRRRRHLPRSTAVFLDQVTADLQSNLPVQHSG